MPGLESLKKQCLTLKNILAVYLMQVEESEVKVSPVPRGHACPQYIPLSSQTSDTEAVVLYPEGCEDRVSLAGRSVLKHKHYLHSKCKS